MRRRWFSTSSSLLFSVLVVAGTASCSEDPEPLTGPGGGAEQSTGGFPREAAIEYKVTSESGLTTALVRYSNETGGEATVDAAALPFTVKVTKTAKQYDVILLGASSGAGGSLTLEIVVDGKSVDKKSFSGTSRVSASTTYDFR